MLSPYRISGKIEKKVVPAVIYKGPLSWKHISVFSIMCLCFVVLVSITIPPNDPSMAISAYGFTVVFVFILLGTAFITWNK